MKKQYIQPTTKMVNVEPHGNILNNTSVQAVAGNAGLQAGGASSNDISGQGARVKGNAVEWDDWSE